MNDLRIVAEKIDALRFASMDQNPFGIRDLLWSEVYKKEGTIKTIQKAKELIGARIDRMTPVEKECSISEVWHLLNNIKI